MLIHCALSRCYAHHCLVHLRCMNSHRVHRRITENHKMSNICESLRAYFASADDDHGHDDAAASDQTTHASHCSSWGVQRRNDFQLQHTPSCNAMWLGYVYIIRLSQIHVLSACTSPSRWVRIELNARQTLVLSSETEIPDTYYLVMCKNARLDVQLFFSGRTWNGNEKSDEIR